MAMMLLTLDDPLVSPQRRREETVRRMAAELVEHNAFHNRDDARLVLRMAGFAAFDIEARLDDVMQAAVQSTVAREMSGS